MSRAIDRFICMLILVTSVSLFSAADGPNFRADKAFDGHSLKGWHPLGAAEWRTENGEFVGVPKSPSGGWLVLDHDFESVALYLDLLCKDGCQAGILLRAEKTQDGMKGLFVSLSETDQASYAVTIDAEGKITSRKKLDPLKGMGEEGGMASPLGNPSPDRMKKILSGQIHVMPIPKGLDLPGLDSPTNEYHPGQWNPVNVELYGNMLDPSFGAGGFVSQPDRLVKSAAAASFGDYGPIALYVGGTGEARFKNIEYKDLEVVRTPKEKVSPEFTEQHINGFYFSWGAAIADVNHDGIPDVIAGPYYYLGPDFTEAHEIYTPQTYNPGTEYPQTSMVALAADFTGDGWPDVLVMSGSAGLGVGTLYVNPRGQSRHWEHYDVLPEVGNETTVLADVDGDGKPEVIHAGHDTLQYSKPDPKNPTGPWITTTISEPGPWGAGIGHGLGVGDINGDGLMDIVNSYGWWEQPPKGSGQKLWTYHPQAFGRRGHTQGGAGGAEIGVYDVNGDGLPDVVTALEGHGFGLAWYEQKRDGAGKITWVEHMIMDNFLTKNAGDVTFTEPHATAFADMDGDGIPDLITGKRMMSHLYNYGDPDALGPAVLYVYRTVRNPKAPGGAEFVPVEVHNLSGVGSNFAVGDLNGDGKPDIATSGIYGTFVFFNHMTRQNASGSSK